MGIPEHSGPFDDLVGAFGWNSEVRSSESNDEPILRLLNQTSLSKLMPMGFTTYNHLTPTTNGRLYRTAPFQG
jgi:hypothetical protein